MATHSRTELFCHFRNSYHGHQNKRLSLGEQDDLLSMAIKPEYRKVQIPVDLEWRQWTQKEQLVRTELKQINSLCTHYNDNLAVVDRLVEQSSRVRYQTAFSGGSMASHDELRLSDDITNRLLKLQRLITDLVMVDNDNGLTVKEQLQVNCQLAHFNRLSITAQRFQSAQQIILKRTLYV